MSSDPEECDSNLSYGLLSDSQLSYDKGTGQTNEPKREKVPSLEVTQSTSTIAPFLDIKDLSTQTDRGQLSGFTVPQKETCPIPERNKVGIQAQHTDLSSSNLLMLPKDSPLLQRNWVTRQDSESDDPLVLVDNLNKAIREVNNAGAKLQHCLEDRGDELNDTKEQLAERERELQASREKNDDCNQELHEYKQRCAEVAEKERDITSYYKGRLVELEDQLKSLTRQKDQADKAHKCEVDSLEQKHKEEKDDLSYTMQLQSRYCRELEKVVREKDTKLEDFKSLLSKFKERKEEVEQLRETLKGKELELHELEQEVQIRTDEVEALKLGAGLKVNKIRELKLSREREGVEEQLKRCQEIRGLVELLPNVTSQEDMEKITEQISKDITKMKAATTMTKSMSWR